MLLIDRYLDPALDFLDREPGPLNYSEDDYFLAGEGILRKDPATGKWYDPDLERPGEYEERRMVRRSSEGIGEPDRRALK